ncbi:hypothetical protein EC991_003650 [Linnemannia zychae]|nr:hypothetical protein EC991_003650 [Linnemannia zychae]
MTVHASELYPTLGSLLELLCRNPVIMAASSARPSESGGQSLPELVAQSHGSKKADRDLFQDLFEVSDKEMNEKKVELTLEIMADNLKSLRDQVVQTELSEVAWSSLVTWNRQLSGLCAPLASTSSAAELVEGIIETAHLLYSKRPQRTSVASLQLLDSSFVELLVMRQSDFAVSAALKESRTLAQLLLVSSLARQGFLVQSIDAVIQDCGCLSEFYQGRHQIVQQYFESSQFLASAVSGHLSEDQHRDLIERLLEKSAELAGEIDDWRVVRIWTLLIEWILRRLGSVESVRIRSSEPDTSILDQEVDLWEVISSASRIVNSSHLKTTGSTKSRLSVNDAVFSEINYLLEIQSRYTFDNAPPQEIALRRRMVFLVGTAVLMSNGILTCLIYQHILLLDEPNLVLLRQDDPSQSSATLLNVLSLLMYGDTGPASISAISIPFTTLLKDLHSILQVSETSNPYDLRLGTVANLEGAFVKYLSFLRLNNVVTADIVCAVVVYNDPENSAFWQSVVCNLVSVKSVTL